MKSRRNKMQNDETIPQKVQKRAYELYLSRGQEPGHELEDWLQAEHEINERQEQHAADSIHSTQQ